MKVLQIVCFFAFALGACKGEKCEGFNLKRIPFDLNYYEKPLSFSNGVDTITLNGSIDYITKESRLGGWANPTCDPRIEITYKGKPFIIDMRLTFEYSPENNYTDLSVSFNASSCKRIKIDSVFTVNLKNNKKKVYHDFENYGQDSTQKLSEFSMKNMRITDFEFLNGIKWHLIENKKKTPNFHLKSFVR